LYTAHNPLRTQSEPPLPLFDITDRGLFADPQHSRLRAFVEARGGKIKDLGICVGTVIEGDVKLEELREGERDDLLAVLVRCDDY
jgi:sulfonate dioxygenase